MKVCIITLYNSLNHGAYLQAYALSKVLEKYNFEVSFLKTGARRPIYNLKDIIKKILKVKFKGAYFDLRKLISWNKYAKVFQVCNINNEELLEKDIFLFGSDEIWNISRKEIKNYPVLFGVGIPDKKFVAYAPSINTTSLEQIKNNIQFVNSIKKFNHLSVRDTHSKNILQNFTSKEIKIVLDPTFLISKETYFNLEEEVKERDYILVYTYENEMTDEQIYTIKKYARSVKLKLISVGFRNKWCDKSVLASPFSFLSYMRNARYVVTTTFHGTVFSIIYNKQFASYAGNKIKVNDILKRLNLEYRNVSGKTDLKNVLEKNIDYENINNVLEDYINDSYNYIDEFIDSTKEK
ncbi:MAG: polysaccharide pyruvyl transferase family protein [bacterium]